MAEVSGRSGAHVDSYPDMVLRRAINDLAERPVDFYAASMEAALHYTTLSESDVILDVGASSGEFIYRAAENAGIRSRLIALDPDDYAYNTYFTDKSEATRLAFMRGIGEAMLLPDSSVKVVTGHNVMFRGTAIDMLTEMQRVCEPGGYIMLSTNARNHGLWRHLYERQTTLAFQYDETAGAPLTPLDPPAEGCYLEDMPKFIERVGGLAIVDMVVQDSDARITRGERLETFIEAIYHSVARTSLPPEMHAAWRRKVDEIITPRILAHIALEEELHAVRGIEGPAYFADKVHRGMLVVRNDKAA